MLRVTLIALALTGIVGSVCAQQPMWATDLYLDGGGHFSKRIAATLANVTDEPVEGRSVSLVCANGDLGAPLVGVSMSEIRVCDAGGQELLFGVKSSDGAPRTEGILEEGDEFFFLGGCQPGDEAIYYVYFGNSRAQTVPDFLSVGFTNGGAEVGDNVPAGWSQTEADAQHVLAWVTEAPHSGARCLKTTVPEGANPSWVKWVQNDIPVAAGGRYRVSGWTRGENVVGAAGWFIHVNGDTPQLINQTLSAGDGTFDWREASAEFVAPESATNATIGTMLRGTGTAWFDDVALTALDAPPGLDIAVGAVEELDLTVVGAPEAWQLNADEWPFRALLTVRNIEDLSREDVVVSASVSRELVRLRGRAGRAGIRVVTADGDSVPHTQIGGRVLFPAALAARSETTFGIYFEAGDAPAKQDDGVEALVDSAANLVADPSFETKGALPPSWIISSESADGKPLCEPSIVEEGAVGEFCAKLQIPDEADLAWAGWHQDVPIRPGASYLYMGHIRAEGLQGSATLHGHIRDADGALVGATPMLSTSPHAADTSGWVLTSAQFRAPADAATLQLHLTANAHGTIYHDGIVVCEVADAQASALESAATSLGAPPLVAWGVDPVVKVFQDEMFDPTTAGPQQVVLARNELETVQLAVRSETAVAGATVSITTPEGPAGVTLPDVRVELVGYVPADAATAYYQSRLGPEYRMKPTGPPMSDGWAGDWPDPLIPDRPVDLEAGRVQPVWLTVQAPKDAAPGLYSSTITVSAGGQDLEIPLSIEVLALALPDETHLKAIYDLRSGPGQDIHEGADTTESLKRWYRFLAERRVSVDTIQPSPTFNFRDGRVVMDTAAFDEMAELCLDELGMTHLYTPWQFYALGWAYPPKDMFGFKAFSDEYVAAFTEAYRMFAEHLRERGWFDKLTYYISDEPHMNVPGVVENLQRVAEIAHAAVPEIPVYSSTWTFDPGLVGALDIWGTGVHGSFPVAEMERRLADGDTLWFTTDGHMCIDTPYCAVERLLPYYALKYDHRAYEFWGVSWWTYDPWERGWHTFIRQSNEGEDYYHIRYPNGDGYLTYPGSPVGVEGPVSSIRLEQARDGLEEYETMLILRDRIEAAPDGPARTEAVEALDEALGLCEIPNMGGLNSTDLLPDPSRLGAVRERLLRAAEALGE